MDTSQKFEVNLRQSLNTDTIAEDFKTFGDNSAPLLENTGIERDGGITNLYETETTYSEAGQYVVTEDGRTISIVDSGVTDYNAVKIDGKTIGNVSKYGVESHARFRDADDAVITSNSYITATVSGGTITVSEYNFAGALQNTRDIDFDNLAAVMQYYTSLTFVRWPSIAYSDDLEFCLRLGDQVIFLYETTPTQTITRSFKTTSVLGTSAVNAVISYNGLLVVAGDSGRLGSFDGVAWRNYNGTGTGSGIYQSGDATASVIGSANIKSLCVYTYNGASYLVVGGASGKIGSFSGGAWFKWDSAGVISTNGGVVSTDTVTCMAQYGTDLIVCGSAGKLGSWSGTAWTAYNAGSGLRNNATLLGAVSINAIVVWTNSGATQTATVMGASGRVGSLTWVAPTLTLKVYTDATTTNYPTNNGVVIGANNILSGCAYGSGFALAGVGGRLGSYDGANWKNYDSTGTGTGPYSSTVLGTNDITNLSKNGVILIASGVGSRIGSFDGTNWKTYSGGGTGTGPYSNGEMLSISGDILASCVFTVGSAVNIIFAGAAGAVNNMNAAYNYTRFYAGTLPLAELLDGITGFNYLYVFKQLEWFPSENGYMICPVGNAQGYSYYLGFGIVTPYGSGTTFNARYMIPQTKNGYTRHIVTTSDISTNHCYDGTSIKCAGLIGFIEFTTNWSNTVVYQSALYTLGNGNILQSAAGYGYADFTFRTTASATDILSYTSQYVKNPPSLFQVIQSNTNTLVNAYGKLTGNMGVTPSVPFEFRVGVINGVQSYFSAALIDEVNADAMGTLITPVGGIDDTYAPMIVSDSIIMYKYNAEWNVIKIGNAVAQYIEKIADGAYKVNTISPLNIIDTVNETLLVGASDYNGRMLFRSTAAPGVATTIAALYSSQYSNSIDVGDKIITITSPTASNIDLIGYRLPVMNTSVAAFAVDVYVADVYAWSVYNNGGESADPNKAGLVYLASSILPVPIGAAYSNGVFIVGGSTFFLKPLYDGSNIGNDIAGEYQTFVLFGQLYLFDGLNIYAANVNQVTGVFNDKAVVAPATGLQFLTSSPTEAYFLSAFDNSIYTFQGGRNLTKFKRMSQMPAVSNGVFSVYDNALLLNTATSFVWVRDGVATENLKAADQTGLVLYDTTSGVIISNNTKKWRYSYIAGTTVVPLAVQTPYFGLNLNDISILKNWIVTVYNSAKTAMVVTGKLYSIDEDTSREQAFSFTVNPNEYNDGGYVRLRIQPQYQRSLGTSLLVQISAKAVLLSVLPEFDKAETAVASATRTR